MVAPDRAVGDHVLGHRRQAADEGVAPDAAVLVDRRQPARPSRSRRYPRGRRASREWARITLSPTMQSWPTWLVAMYMPSLPTRVTPPALGRADVHRHMFPDHVAVADDQLGRLALVAGVVRRPAEVGEVADRAVLADPRVALDDHVDCSVVRGADPGVLADDADRARCSTPSASSAPLATIAVGWMSTLTWCPPPWRRTPPRRRPCRRPGRGP